VIDVNRGAHTDRDHLHVSAMKVALQLVHVLGDDAFVDRVELTSTTMFVEGAIAPTGDVLAGDVLFFVHVEMIEESEDGPSRMKGNVKREGGYGERVVKWSKYGRRQQCLDPGRPRCPPNNELP
jgi:hypothetical protein